MRITRSEINEREIVRSCHLFADWITEESRGSLANMLPQDAEALVEQARKKLSVIAINDVTFLGHATLWEYERNSVAEVGALIVHPSYRGMGIGKDLIGKVIEEFEAQYDILTATVKTVAAERAFLENGFLRTPFHSLSRDIRKDCCVCYSPFEKCPKKNKECRLLIYSGR